MKNIKLLPTVLTILFALSITACKKKNCDDNFDKHFALQVGNTWIYEESYFYPDTASTPSNVSIVKQEIIKDTLIDNGQQAYIVEQTYPTSTSRFLRYEVDSELRERPINATLYSVLYKKTMQLDMEWVLMPGVNNQDFNSRKVTAELPQYNFLQTTAFAYKVENGNPKLNDPSEYGELIEDIFAPNIGVLEHSARISYYGPSRRHRLLKEYHSN